jgi:hypothetical protein
MGGKFILALVSALASEAAVLVAVGVSTGAAHADVDWKYYGGVDDGDTRCFFDLKGVTRSAS